MAARINAFYLPTDRWPKNFDDPVTLDGAEASHMLKVLRTRKGDEVELMDGHGRIGVFVLKESTGTKATLAPLNMTVHPPRLGGMTLAMGWTKSSRRGVFLEKCVELQASGVTFWQADRSQGSMPTAPKPTWTEKCIQAAKQCRNPYLPELSVTPSGINGLIHFARDFEKRYIAWIDPDLPLLAPDMLASVRSLMVIGPEGGMTENELSMLARVGFTPVYLGDSIFRWETAAQYSLSLSFQANQERTK